MPIELKMPALSPTMEEGTLAKWLVKEGDTVKSGDILAEIETDKATMEFEAVDEGTIAKILVAEGTDGVKVGAPIAMLAGEGEDASAPPRSGTEGRTAAPAARTRRRRSLPPAPPPQAPVETPAAPRSTARPREPRATGSRRARSRGASPRRRASTWRRSRAAGPGGRIVRADLGTAAGGAPRAPAGRAGAAAARRAGRARRHPARGRQALATCARRSRGG